MSTLEIIEELETKLENTKKEINQMKAELAVERKKNQLLKMKLEAVEKAYLN